MSDLEICYSTSNSSFNAGPALELCIRRRVQETDETGKSCLRQRANHTRQTFSTVKQQKHGPRENGIRGAESDTGWDQRSLRNG